MAELSPNPAGEAAAGDPASDPAPAADAAKPDAPAADKPAPAADPAPVADWRASIKDDGARKYAEQFTTQEDLARDALAKRKQLSTAIIPPGEKATPAEIAEYDKRMGVPDVYTFDMPEGRQPTDAEKAFHTEVAEVFKANKLTAAQAKGVNAWWNEKQAAVLAAEQKAQEASQQAQDAALRKDWGGDYDANVRIAGAAWAKYGGGPEVENLKLADGSRVGDHPAVMKMFAQIGRTTMESPGLIGMPDGEIASLQERHRSVIRQKIEAAAKGDHAEAQRLDRQSVEIAGKLSATAAAR